MDPDQKLTAVPPHEKRESYVEKDSVALEGIENILKSGQRNLNADGTNPFVAVVEMAQGVDRMKDLHRHENHKINDTAVKILKSYFDVDEDEKEKQDSQ